MDKYSPAVALFDYFPVLIGGAALLLLARGIGARHRQWAPAAWLAALLVMLGGLCKASWKLLIAVAELPLDWLENLLFILLAPGFLIMLICLRQAARAWRKGVRPDDAQAARLPLLIGLPLILGGALTLAVVSADSRLWFFWLLGVTTILNIAMLIEAGRLSHWAGLGVGVIIGLLLNFLATLALSGLARLPAGEATAWIQQSVNLLAQSALLYACWRLAAAMRESTEDTA